MTRLIKIEIIAAVLILIIFIVSWFLKPIVRNNIQSSPETNQGKISIVATMYPLGFLAERVGGNNVTVKVITPPGAEPHDFEPTPQDIVEAKKSKIFMLNGKSLDVWAENVSRSLVESGTKIINLSNFAPPSEDPHLWLDLDVMKKATDALAVLLSEINPANKKIYVANAESLKQDFIDIDDKYIQALKSCELHDIVVSHDAFGYLADRYDFQTINIAGLSTEEEPSAKHLSEITDSVRKKNIKYIFFETLVSPKLSELIANETNTKTLVLNPIESLIEEEIRQGKNYLTIMTENLTNLRQAMLCR